MRLQPLEKDIQAAIIQAFWFRHRIHLDAIDAGGKSMRRGGSDGQTGIPTGFPDLLGCIPPHGVMLSIEVKRPGQKPTRAQLDFMARRQVEGSIAFWADSVDSALEQFAAAMTARAA